MNHYFTWSDETFAAMQLLWTEGKSAAEIGRRIGCSRNAVLGKVHRHGLHVTAPRKKTPKCTVPPEHRPPPRKRILSVTPSLPKLAPAPVLRLPPPPRPAPPPANQPLAGTHPVPLMEMTGCKWPVNDGDPVFMFCNAEIKEGRPYCEQHDRLSTVGIPVRGRPRLSRAA